jgi:hypothetical protein
MLSYGAVAFACCLLLAQPARAAFDTTINVKVGDTVRFFDSPSLPRTGSGGPFLGAINAPFSNSWAAYCVESGTPPTTEYINFTPNNNPLSNSYAYKVGSITANIASATGNIVTGAAKFLYYAAGHGFSIGTTYNPNSASDNAELQEAIWSLVIAGNSPNYNPNDVNPANYTPGNLYTYLGGVSGKAANYRNWAIGNLNLNLASRINVLNPVTLNAQGQVIANHQSMLYEVPEPASLVVWSVLAGSAAGLTVARRKRRNAPAGRWSAESRSAIFAVVDKCE